MTILACRFALDPTPAQERSLRSRAGAARAAFNWGLARVKAVVGQRAAEVTYGMAGDDLSRKGKREGKPAGFPRFKSKRKARP